MKLNDTTVATLSCPAGRKDFVVSDSTLAGFRVRVQANGTRTFLFAYKLGRVSRRVPLGAFGDVTTAAARREAERLRGEVRAGRDPWGERRATTAAILVAEREARANRAEKAFTVGVLIDLYAEKHVANLRPATQRDVLSRLRLHLATIKAKPATDIGRREAATVVDRAAKAGETTARRVRDYARAMWGWAQGRGTLPDGAANPWEHAPVPGRDVPRDRVLSDDEIGHVWRAAGTLAMPYGPMNRFLLLTLARREEATAMTWGEVAADLSTWTQPAARTKNGKAHIVHLSEPARLILRALLGAEEGKPLPALPKADRLVFAIPGNKAVTSHSWVKRALDKAIAEARAEAAKSAGEAMPDLLPHWTLHDYRRSGVTWLAGAGFPPHVADRLLNHIQGTIKGVAAIYQRGEFLEERARALDAWGAHVVACGEAQPVVANMVVLSERRGRRAA
jgi:integrase